MKEIGSKIRWLRRSQGLTLEVFAKKVGMTQPHLSLIETGKRGIGIPVLRRILYALNTNLAAFFSSDFHDHKIVYKKRDGIALPSNKSVKIRLLVPVEGGRLLASSESVISPGGTMGDSTSHKGEEFGFVLKGTGRLIVEGRKYEVKKGDSFYYDAHLPHTIQNTSKNEKLHLLVVATPPSF